LANKIGGGSTMGIRSQVRVWGGLVWTSINAHTCLFPTLTTVFY